MKKVGNEGVITVEEAKSLKLSVESAGRHRLDDEPHLGKAVAAEICRRAGILARLVCEKVEVKAGSLPELGRIADKLKLMPDKPQRS
jgi:hypothetical protein